MTNGLVKAQSSGTQHDTWWLSWNASGTEPCGASLTQACRNLSQIVPQLAVGDTIMVQGSLQANLSRGDFCSETPPPDQRLYSCEGGLTIHFPVSIVGFDGLAVFDCKRQSRAIFFDMSAYRPSNDSASSNTVTLESLAVFNGLTDSPKLGGGAVAFDVNAAVQLRLVRLAMCGNAARKSSGGAVAVASAGNVTVSGCFFSKNWALQSGGAMMVAAVINEEFLDVGLQIAVDMSGFSGNAANETGGALALGVAIPPGGPAFIREVTVALTRCSFANNTVVSTSSANELTVRGASASVTFFNATGYSSVVMQNLLSSGNSLVVSGASTLSGGSVDVSFLSAVTHVSVALQLSLFSGDSASNSGDGSVKGAAVAVAVLGNATASSFSFDQNSFKSNLGKGGPDGAAMGGALSVYMPTGSNLNNVAVTRSTFSGNRAVSGLGNSMGGAVAMYFGGTTADNTVTMDTLVMGGNTAVGGGGNGNALGGAVSVFYNNYGTGNEHVLSNSMLDSNSCYAPNNGNAVGGGFSMFFNNEASNNSLTVSSCKFSSNAISGAQQGVDVGAGLAVFYNDQSSNNRHSVSASSFLNNTLTVHQNGVSTGGGLAIYGNSGQSSNSIDLFTGNTFRDNVALVCPQYVLTPIGQCK
ncbi:MAG: hypothetical protein Q8P67_04140 [archaeon]|nr:hypothetical protein [archaeon]